MTDSLFASINGALVPAEEAMLPASDMAVQRGYGVFDFFKTLSGRPIFVDDHLDRFFHSAERMRLPVGRSRDELKKHLLNLIARNAIADSGVRITLTGGCAADGYSVGTPNLVIIQQPLRVNATLASRGAKLVTHAHRRQFPDVKTIDYLMAVWLQPELAARGADDVLYVWDGRISECPRSNVFIVTDDGALATPPLGSVLAGIIRKNVLDIARRDGLNVQEREVTLGELRAAREVFMTSTTKGVLPVVAIDAAPVGDGAIGKVSARLGELLAERIGSQHG